MARRTHRTCATVTAMCVLTFAVMVAYARPAQAVIRLGAANTISLTNGLVGYWPLDGAVTNWTTNTTQDISGNGNTGQMIGMSTTTSPVPGKIGGALNFSGLVPGSYISTPSENISGTVSVSAWVYSSNFGQGGGMVVEKDPVNAQWELFVQSGVLYWRGDGVDNNTTCTAPSNNKWHHLVGQQSGTATAIYIDGVLCASGSSTAFTDSGGAINIGAFTGGYYFLGAIDDVRIYNRALSAGEIKQLYNLGTANAAHSNTVAVSNGLVGYWTFDGGATNWTTNTTQDISGNGNTGSLINMSTTTSPVAGKFGQALNFNSSASTYVDVPITLTPSAITVSVWFKASADSGGILVDNGVPNVSNEGFSLDPGSGGGFGTFWIGNGIDACRGFSQLFSGSLNTWFNYVGVYDGSSIYTYVNGALDRVTACTGGAIAASGFDVNIGRYANFNSNYFDGIIDDVRLYKRALSAAEVQQLYEVGTAIIAHSNTVALSNGLVGYWTFDGGVTNWTTNSTQDVSGNGNTGQMIGMSTTTSPVAGKIGQALQFDGASSYVVPGVNLPLSNDNIPFTVSAWFKTSSNGVILSSQSGVPAGGAYDPLLYIDTNGKLHGGGYSGGIPNLLSSTALNNNKWHLALLTYDGSAQKLYVDGAFVAQAGALGGVGSTAYWILGVGETNGWPNTNNSTFYFNGAIDDARVYNRAISAAEVEQLYLTGK